MRQVVIVIADTNINLVFRHSFFLLLADSFAVSDITDNDITLQDKTQYHRQIHHILRS